MRLFVGAFAPPDVAAAIRGAVAGLAARVPVAEDIHLTLHFLGETDAAAIPGITAALEREVARRSEVPLWIRGTGAFPDFERARVLWIGVEEAGVAGRLLDLARAVGNAESPWTPHLTVARPRRRGHLEVPEPFRALRFDLPWTLAEVHLAASHPAPEGSARYRSIARFRLRPESL
jgi:2'-5' RNA ligase